MEKKSFFIIGLFVCLAMTLKGQSTSGLLTDGRGWAYRYDVVMGDVFSSTDYEVFFYGDTIIDGRQCKKMYVSLVLDNDYSTPSTWFAEIGRVGTYNSAWYEDDKKVYRILKNTTISELVFDFGLKKGDKLPQNDNLVYWYDDYITVDGIITDKGTKTGSHTYRRMRFAEGGLTENPKLSDWCLVDGIGGNEGILFTEFQTAPRNGCIYEKFEFCEQFLESRDGYPVYENLFRMEDFLITGAIVEEGKKCATPTVAYADGKLVFGCETPGVEFVYEIKCADAGSGRGDEVSLGQIYEICVYATLEGHYDSDMATATIGWRNGQPVMEGFSSITIDGEDGRGDVNYDGKIDVADIAKILSMMAGAADK